MVTSPQNLPPTVVAAFQAADAKKALDPKILDLRPVTSFTDYFLICSGSNPRQNHAISDEIGSRLAEMGYKPLSTEGYESANWILMDYGDFLVHIFSPESREYYDLERLWSVAETVPAPVAPLAVA
ncbi:MAG: ribosome silencing factor [Bryobacter sp.]|nr:ribosome silencing factor [Bryobacter sp.]